MCKAQAGRRSANICRVRIFLYIYLHVYQNSSISIYMNNSLNMHTCVSTRRCSGQTRWRPATRFREHIYLYLYLQICISIYLSMYLYVWTNLWIYKHACREEGATVKQDETCNQMSSMKPVTKCRYIYFYTYIYVSTYIYIYLYLYN